MSAAWPRLPSPHLRWLTPLAELKEGALGGRSPSMSTGTPGGASIDRSATPTPATASSSSSAGNPLASSTGAPISRSGMLAIRVIDARGLSLPSGVPVPPTIARALTADASGQMGSLAGSGAGNRASLQRRQAWWLPYLVLEFDRNEVLIDAMGGDLQGPTWMYKAHL